MISAVFVLPVVLLAWVCLQKRGWAFAIPSLFASILYVTLFFYLTQYKPDPHPSLDFMNQRYFRNDASALAWWPMRIYDRWRYGPVRWCHLDGAPLFL